PISGDGRRVRCNRPTVADVQRRCPGFSRGARSAIRERRMTDAARTITVKALARVEGEGGLTIRLKDGVPESVELRIFEPPRFYEAFLRGRSALEAPDVTARICGICPVAYQMSACGAGE